MLVKSQIKYIQSLGQKKHRDELGLFIAEGPRIIEELIASSPGSIKDIYATADWIGLNMHLTTKFSVHTIEEYELAKISQLQTPNQVLAVVKKWETNPSISAKNKLTLVLDRIQDPGNLGTIVRIADWFGLSQLVMSEESADIYNPKVVQSTMGSIARIQFIYTNLQKWLAHQKDVPVFAAMLEGESIEKMTPLKEGILVIGNESKGVSDEVLKLVNRKITIPRKGKAESLNAAVATGIILSHLTRS